MNAALPWQALLEVFWGRSIVGYADRGKLGTESRLSRNDMEQELLD